MKFLEGTEFQLWWANPTSKVFVYSVIGITVISILSRWSTTSTPTYSKKFVKQMNRIVQQVAKWHQLNRSTDALHKDPAQSLMYTNYALAYAQAVRALASDDMIQNTTGIKLRNLISSLEEDQKNAITQLSIKCPAAKPTGVIQTTQAWM